jgi:glycosyltransferase involved in cell wall biosynthesis
MNNLKLSLIIPCYNESQSLPRLIARLKECFTRSDVEVILVDNGSKDATPQILAEQLAGSTLLRSVRVEVNQGYGYGILQGLKAARGTYIGWTHADLQTDPFDAIRALEIIESEGSPENLFVKGTRYGRPLFDRLFSMGMGLFESLYLRVRLWEINAQPTIFPKVFFESWSDPPHDFSLDLYSFYQARVQGLAVLRFPVYFGKREFGISHWNVDWSSKVKFIKRTLDFSFKLKKRLTVPNLHSCGKSFDR